MCEHPLGSCMSGEPQGSPKSEDPRGSSMSEDPRGSFMPEDPRGSCVFYVLNCKEPRRLLVTSMLMSEDS